MNKLEDYFWNYDNKLTIHKWHHYFKIYDRHFSKFIGKDPTILEIGVSQGGSLEMWNHYFNGQCTIYGVDNRSHCLKVPEQLGAKNIHVALGDQGSRKFWREYLKNKPRFDIVIDDDGHTMRQQIITYEELYDHVADNGVYLCEDLHTSYWKEFGGGLNDPATFVEYSKNFIDMLNFHHIRDDVDDRYKKFRQSTESIHYYDSIVVLEKTMDLKKPTATVNRGSYNF